MKLYIILIILSLLTLLSCYILIFLKKYEINETLKLNLYNGNEPLKYIPKKIFQLVANKDNIDPSFQKNIEFIQKQNPDWQYTLLDDKDIEKYILDHYGQSYLDIYHMINPKYGAARADYFRYLLMYKEGGVYFDIKSGSKYPLNNIIFPDDEYILSHWECECNNQELQNEWGEYQQWHIICRPNHPFLKAVIDLVTENILTYRISDGIGKPGTLKVTGPIAYTEAIEPIVNDHNCRIIELYETTGLVYNNIGNNHTKKFTKAHYSEITEPIIIKPINK